MRTRNISVVIIALIATVAATGCGKKAGQATTESSSDSLVATNPTERPSGNLTPETPYQEPPKAEAPPATPKPRAVKPAPRPSPRPAQAQRPAEAPGISMAAGTPIKVEVTAAITSETAQAGDSWTGTVQDNVIVDDRVLIPAGSTVSGVVAASKPAKSGDRAMLLLGVTSVNVHGRDIAVRGSTDSIIAGSTRARNLGAIGGGAAAGAVIGHAIGGSGKGSLIGALIGGAATGAAVSRTKGYQVAIKPGTHITFATDESVVFRP